MKCRWFKPANYNARGTRDAWADDMPPPGISGVYAIADLDGNTLYVGESHTGRLRKTMQRHFQVWNDDWARAPRQTYDRFRVQVCWIQCAPGEALDIEADWMSELDPSDNLAGPLEVGYPAEYADEDLEYEPVADEAAPF